MRLLRVELRRILLRRLVWLMVAAGVALVLPSIGGASSAAQRPTAEEVDAARQLYDYDLTDWQEFGAERVVECEEEQARESERAGEQLDYGCDELEPLFEDYLPREISLQDYVTDYGVVWEWTATAMFAGLALGATLVAAEFKTGAMSTLLTFEPRRLRVFAAKLAAPVFAAVPLALVLLALLIGGTWLMFVFHGAQSAVTADMLVVVARLVTVLPLAAALGVLLGFTVRSTSLVIGLVVGYAVAVEFILIGIWPWLARWTIGANLDGWLMEGTEYYVPGDCGVDDAGASFCADQVVTMSQASCIAYLAVLLIVLTIAAALRFLRSDVDG